MGKRRVAASLPTLPLETSFKIKKELIEEKTRSVSGGVFSKREFVSKFSLFLPTFIGSFFNKHIVGTRFEF